MSYDSWNDGGLTPLERAAGLWGILYGRNDGERSSGAWDECDECEWGAETEISRQQKELENSARFKEATKLIAGLNGNRETKLRLIQKVQQDSLDSAIVRYMASEALPEYYASILKNPNCIDRLVEGIFYKVCKMHPSQTLAEGVSNLSSSLRSNPSRLTAYDRVTHIQQFIHRTVDQYLGVGAAQSIPVAPMKNALSAARLHLSIFDVTNHQPRYVFYLDNLSTAAAQFEYEEPRPSSAPSGKRSWSRWRVRHLRPLSYYFPKERRALLQALSNLDENVSRDKFVSDALLLYAKTT